MKNLAFTLLLTPVLLAAAKPKPAPNPADYPLTMQVKCSFVTPAGNGQMGMSTVHLGGTLDGKTVELTNVGLTLPYVPGAYKLRLLADHSPDAYELNQAYQLYLPDGNLRTFGLNGIGQDVCAAPAS